MTEPTVEQNFLEQQYIALRTETEQASERAFKIFAASVLVVPAGLTLGGAAAGSNVLPLIKMLLPLLLLAFYAMYWAQIFSTYRTGLYIQSHIEAKLLDHAQGWESWLSDRRYAYDAQVRVAFSLLSTVYYLGTVYLAVTATVKGSSPLKPLTSFLNIASQRWTVLLPDQLAEKLSYERMLFIFYALAAVVVVFLAQLILKRELEEDRKLEQIMEGETVVEEGELQQRIQQHLHETKKGTNKLFGQGLLEGRIKHCFCYKDASRGASPAWYMRLTIRKSLKETLSGNLLHTLVGLVTVLVLLSWAYVLIQRVYYRLARPEYLDFEWLLPSGSIPVLIQLGPLVLLAVLLLLLYRFNIGQTLGAKVTIKILPAKVLPSKVPMTRYIVRTTVGEKNHERVKRWIENALLLRTSQKPD